MPRRSTNSTTTATTPIGAASSRLHRVRRQRRGLPPTAAPNGPSPSKSEGEAGPSIAYRQFHELAPKPEEERVMASNSDLKAQLVAALCGPLFVVGYIV